MTDEATLAAAFTGCRPLLLRVAYAVLGSHADAEDVVSDCWPALVRSDSSQPIRDVQAWATVAVSRRALDLLRSARVRRERYVGPWLPEPVLDRAGGAGGSSSELGDPADRVTLDDTVSYALLVVLETLSPAERTAWVLHDLFGMEFSEVASVVGRTESAVRQLASRARRHVAEGTPRVSVSADLHRATTEAFALACAEGNIDKLVSLLDPKVVLTSDGGGQVVAAKRPVVGVNKVALFLTRIARNVTPRERAEITAVNGMAGIVIRDPDRIQSVISLTVDAGLITRVDIIRAPDKLAHVS